MVFRGFHEIILDVPIHFLETNDLIFGDFMLPLEYSTVEDVFNFKDRSYSALPSCMLRRTMAELGRKMTKADRLHIQQRFEQRQRKRQRPLVSRSWYLCGVRWKLSLCWFVFVQTLFAKETEHEGAGCWLARKWLRPNKDTKKSIEIHRTYVAPPCLHAYQFLVPVIALDRPRFITRRFNGLMAHLAGKADRIWRPVLSSLQHFAAHCSHNGRGGMNRPWRPSRLWWKLIQMLKCI